MEDPPDELSPYAAAMEWVARITAVGLEMCLPGIAGQWLDQRLGTSFFTLLGFGLGFVGGLAHLLVMTGAFKPSPRAKHNHDGNQDHLSHPDKDGRDAPD